MESKNPIKEKDNMERLIECNKTKLETEDRLRDLHLERRRALASLLEMDNEKAPKAKVAAAKQKLTDIDKDIEITSQSIEILDAQIESEAVAYVQGEMKNSEATLEALKEEEITMHKALASHLKSASEYAAALGYGAISGGVSRVIKDGFGRPNPEYAKLKQYMGEVDFEKPSDRFRQRMQKAQNLKTKAGNLAAVGQAHFMRGEIQKAKNRAYRHAAGLEV